MVPEDDWYTWLRQADHTASRDFDKAILTLSSGALGVSIAFVNSVVPDDPKLTVLLALSWIAFALSLLIILTAYLTGMRSLRRDMRVGPGAPPDEREGGWLGRLTQPLNIASAVALWSALPCSSSSPRSTSRRKTVTDKERPPVPEPIVELVIEPHPDVEGRAYSPPPPRTVEPEGKFAYTTPPDRPELIIVVQAVATEPTYPEPATQPAPTTPPPEPSGS